MHRQFLANTILVVALLFSQGGNLIVAAFCPHLQSGMASCETTSSESASVHEGMAHEGMDHVGHMEMQHEPAPPTNPDAITAGQSTEQCSHCVVHSRKVPNATSLRATQSAKRSAELSIPFHSLTIGPVTVALVPVLTSRAHGPPGDPPPRHILINVFRI